VSFELRSCTGAAIPERGAPDGDMTFAEGSSVIPARALDHPATPPASTTEHHPIVVKPPTPHVLLPLLTTNSLVGFAWSSDTPITGEPAVAEATTVTLTAFPMDTGYVSARTAIRRKTCKLRNSMPSEFSCYAVHLTAK